MVVALYGTDLAEKVGKLNMARFDRGHLIGSRVNSEQPSGIVDPSIKNGFYGAPSAVCVFCQKDFAFSVPDAFVIAQAMALEAHGLGISSCIVSRSEQTFCLRRRPEPSCRVGRSRKLHLPRFPCIGMLRGVIPAGEAP